jgi:hypothetical protein
MYRLQWVTARALTGRLDGLIRVECALLLWAEVLLPLTL